MTARAGAPLLATVDARCARCGTIIHVSHGSAVPRCPACGSYLYPDPKDVPEAVPAKADNETRCVEPAPAAPYVPPMVPTEDMRPTAEENACALLLENDRGRAWDLHVGLGKSAPSPGLGADRVSIGLTKSRAAHYTVSSGVSKQQEGSVRYIGKEHSVSAVRNAGASSHREIIVELKDPHGPPASEGA